MDLLAQSNDGGGSAILWLIYVAFIVVYLVAAWIVYTKAGEEGWKALIPIYNMGAAEDRRQTGVVADPLPDPVRELVIWIIVSIDLAKSFGKGTGFALGLIFFAPIFYMILAFGDATYRGPAAAPGGAPRRRRCRRHRPDRPTFRERGAVHRTAPLAYGAGDGNRTRIASLEGWNSAIELHPQAPRRLQSLATMRADTASP